MSETQVKGEKNTGLRKMMQSDLTETKIYGNIFVFSFAGHNTTANVLAFAVELLATRPAILDWIAEELQGVIGYKEPTEWSYHDDFSPLKRCLAVIVSNTDTSLLSYHNKPNHVIQVRDRPPLHSYCQDLCYPH